MISEAPHIDIHDFLQQESLKTLLRFNTAGSVDDGKSTLIGRLLHDSHNAYEDQLKSVQTASGDIDLARLTDGLRAEREQGITIDVAYRYFSTPRRKYILADTPGHVQYTRNMVTGASTSDLAIILLDAERGIFPQSKHHARISALLGIKTFVIAVNKMDVVHYSKDVFDKIVDEFSQFLYELNVQQFQFIPVSALLGDNVVTPSEIMAWYYGPTLLEFLETVVTVDDVSENFRFPVQLVLRPDRKFRGYAGQVSSGTIRVGDEVTILPSGRKSRVTRIVTFDGNVAKASAGQSVILTLDDEIDISRGDMIVSGEPPESTRNFEADIVWFDNADSVPDEEYLLKHTTQTVRGKLNGAVLSMNDIGRVSISTFSNVFLDKYSENRRTGAFILIDPMTNLTVAAGMVR